jgi:hypothetical protein
MYVVSTEISIEGIWVSDGDPTSVFVTGWHWILRNARSRNTFNSGLRVLVAIG